MMRNSLIIRNGCLKDGVKILPIWDEFIDYHKKITDQDLEMLNDAGEMWVKYFNRHVRSPIRKAIVAEQNGKIIGFLIGAIQRRPPIFTKSHQAYIDSIGVIESRRNQGIATMMLNLFTDWAKEKKLPYIMLNVAVENDVAIRLYEQHGFKTVILSQRKLL